MCIHVTEKHTYGGTLMSCDQLHNRRHLAAVDDPAAMAMATQLRVCIAVREGAEADSQYRAGVCKTDGKSARIAALRERTDFRP